MDLSYWIDAADHIARVSEAWDVFALENDAPELLAASVVGQSLWTFVSDSSTRHLYERLVRDARDGRTFRFPLRCDAPALRRRLEMSMAADGALVRFDTRLLAVEPRAPQRALDRRVVHAGPLLRSCSWCGRIEYDDVWVEIDEAISGYQLFDDHPVRGVTHGICPECMAQVSGL